MPLAAKVLKTHHGEYEVLRLTGMIRMTCPLARLGEKVIGGYGFITPDQRDGHRERDLYFRYNSMRDPRQFKEGLKVEYTLIRVLQKGKHSRAVDIVVIV